MATERNEYGDFAATRELAEQARGGARAAGDRPLEALAAAMAADAANCALRGDDADAVAAVDRKIAEAGALIDGLADEQVATHLDMLLTLAITRLFSGDFPGAHAAAERGLALARRTSQGLLAPAFVCVRGFVDQELGRLDSAQADQEEALDSALLSGNVQVHYWASIESSVLALQRGEIEAALEHGRVAWELLGTREYSQAGFVVADARLAAGDPAGAREALEAFGWVRPQMWTLDRVKAAEIAVRVLLALGRVDDARRRGPTACRSRAAAVAPASSERSPRVREPRCCLRPARPRRRHRSPPRAPSRRRPHTRRSGPRAAGRSRGKRWPPPAGGTPRASCCGAPRRSSTRSARSARATRR